MSEDKDEEKAVKTAIIVTLAFLFISTVVLGSQKAPKSSE